MIVYDKEQKEIVIPNGIGNINLFNNGVEAGYNQGYEQGQADIAAKARVLNVTENGVYKSKFSDPIIPDNYTVTGVYADGTEFYSYAELDGKVFNTKIAGSVDSRLEFWYKGDNTSASDGWNLIIGSGDLEGSRCFQVRYFAFYNDKLCIGGSSRVFVDGWDDAVWHHLIVSKTEGIWIDGEKKGDFPASIYIDGEFFINGIGYNTERNANGYFGMIKIDDTTIIPTANGFLNTNTGELLEVVKDGTYTFTENDPIYGEGELYKTINVNVPDLNGSYDEGYAQGKTDGINEQKGKLESINITENGTYRKEDGYNEVVVNVADLNGSYDEGYSQGQADVAANARVLNVTENGVYRSKFSDPILPTVTGVYADGTEFHNYAELNGKVFNTKIVGSVDSRLEFWYKGDNTLASDFWNVIIGSGDIDNSDCFQVRYFIDLNNQLSIEVGNSNNLVDNWDDTVWHHLIISKPEGLWIDGEKKGDFSPSNTINGEFFINGIGYNKDGSRSANGTFGMIKIDNTIIIPTADGFQNVNTGELLEVVQDGIYNFTESLPIYAEGELYKTINVNVPLVSCNLGEGEFEFSIADLGTTYELYSSEEGGYDGWSKVTIRLIDGEPVNVYSAGGIFEDYLKGMSPALGNYGYVCGKITEIQEVNTSAENNYASFTLDNCFKVGKAKWFYWHYGKEQFESKDQIKVGATVVVYGIFQDNNGSLQFEEGTGMIAAYQECRPKINVQKTGLKLGYSSFTEVPEWADFEGITNMNHMFSNCGSLQTMPLIDTSNVTDMNNMFYRCGNLQTIPLLDTSKVTDMNNMFYYCNNLQTMPLIDTSNVTDMSYMFYYCNNLQTIPPLNTSNVTNMEGIFAYCSKLQAIPHIDTSKVTNMINMFGKCSSLVSIPALNAQSLNMASYDGIFDYNELPNITDFGGFLNLKCSLTNDKNLKKLPNLTKESCINVLNGLYDFVAAGETPNSRQGKLKVAQSFIDKVGDEISIGTAKGWQITA